LEREEDDEEPSDLEVWHLQKLNYTFKDLGIWKKEGTLDKKYQKQMRERGKRKRKRLRLGLGRINEKRRTERSLMTVERTVGMELEVQRKGRK